MKRLIIFPVLVTFFLGSFISAGRAGRPYVHPRILATQDCPPPSNYLLCDDCFNQVKMSCELASLSGKFVFGLDPAWETLPPSVGLRPTTRKHYSWLGLGCGGLPA